MVSGEGASAEVVSTQISYISAHPPVGEKEDYNPKDARIFMVDGWYCKQETFLNAVQPGQRLHLRNNRHQPIIYGLYSTNPFEAEGIVIDADPEARTVTVRHMTDRNQKKTTEQTYTLPEDGILRYEGEQATFAEAVKKGRHVRAHGARKQTILSITPEARLDSVAERKKAWPNAESKVWANEGYFAGYYHNKAFFTGEPFRERDGHDDLMNTYQRIGDVSDTQFSAKTIINGQFVLPGAAFRHGGRALFVPDPIHCNERASHVIMHPTDNGSIEGRVKELDGDTLRLRVTRTATGRAEDLKRETVTVQLKKDANYHLNGKPGASREEALSLGNTVRVLPEWSGALLVRDVDTDKGRVSGYGVVNKVTGSLEKPFTEKTPARFHLRFPHVLITPLSPRQYMDATFKWKDGSIHDLKIFNERFSEEWNVKNVKSDLRIDGKELSGWIQGNFTGGTLSNHGRDGVYRFRIEAQVRNNVVDGEIRKITVDGTPSGEVDKTHVGELDTHLGGTVQVGPEKGKTGVYRLRFHGNKKKSLQPVVYLRRTENGWSDAFVIFGGNRWGYLKEVDPANFQLTSNGLQGSLRVKLSEILLDNRSEPQWKTYDLSLEEAKNSDDRDAPRFKGRSSVVFGEDPILWIGPEGKPKQK